VSEFQHYEFVAIERPLSDAARRRLRAITSRATITSTHLVNTYEWGSFKGDPFELVAKYFDAFFYYGNGCSRRLMLRVPKAALDWTSVGRYCATHARRSRSSSAASATAAGRHVIFDFASDDASGMDEDDTPPATLAALVPLRDEFMRGDLRGLYVAWRARVQAGEIGARHAAAPKPAGPPRPSGSQQALAEFLRVNGADSEAYEPADPSRYRSMRAANSSKSGSRSRRTSSTTWRSTTR
jgi:hypothetical protein